MAKSSGISTLEFAVVAAGFATLAGMLLAALLHYEEVAEKTVVEVTIVNMRTGLKLRVAELIIKGRESDIAGLVNANPMAWLDRPPSGYIGERDSLSLQAVEAGSWSYDPALQEIAYRPRLHSRLSIQGGGILRWKVQARGISKTGVTEGIEIRQLTPYQWF